MNSRSKPGNMKKKVPRFKTDEEAERFLERDLTDYLNLKNFTPVTFELLPKTRQVNLRFSEPLLNAVRRRKAFHTKNSFAGQWKAHSRKSPRPSPDSATGWNKKNPVRPG